MHGLFFILQSAAAIWLTDLENCKNVLIKWMVSGYNMWLGSCLNCLEKTFLRCVLFCFLPQVFCMVRDHSLAPSGFGMECRHWALRQCLVSAHMQSPVTHKFCLLVVLHICMFGFAIVNMCYLFAGYILLAVFHVII